MNLKKYFLAIVELSFFFWIQILTFIVFTKLKL